MSAALIDLTDEAFLAGDRTEAYATLRASGAAVPVPGDGPPTWLITRHADVSAIARIPEARLQPPGMDAPPWLDEGPALDRLRANLAQADAPVHTRLRRAVGPFFLPRRVQEFREAAADSVARAIARIADLDEPFDVVQDLAVDVPKGVICRFLGMPEDDWARLTDVQHDFLLIFSPFPLDDRQKAALDGVTRFYLDYFQTVLDARDAAEHTPFVQTLLAAEQDGDLTRVEVLSLMHTVLDAGYETTRTSISNIVEMLAAQPELFDEIRANPDVSDNAVEEFLRVESPVHIRERYLVADYTASDGTVIPAGAKVILMLACANRDESVFDEPDRIQLTRHNAKRHQAFGSGIHHCLGAPLARIQLQETLKGLAAMFRRLDLTAGRGPRHPMLMFPALASLPVRAHRAEARH